MKPLQFFYPLNRMLPGMFFLVGQRNPPAIVTELATLNSGVTDRISVTTFDFLATRLKGKKRIWRSDPIELSE